MSAHHRPSVGDSKNSTCAPKTPLANAGACFEARVQRVASDA